MAKGTIGGEISIVGLEEGITRIEKKMTNLSANFTRNSNNIIKAFQEIGTNGIQPLLSKLTELQTAINKVNVPQRGPKTNPYAKNVDDVNKAINSLSKNDAGLINIKKRIDDLLVQLSKAKNDIVLYKQAIGSGKATYIEFGQAGLKEAEKRAESLMRQITALSTAYEQLKNSSVTLTDKGTFSDQKTSENRKRIAAQQREYYTNLEKEAQAEAKRAEQREKTNAKIELSNQRAAKKAEEAREREAKAAELAAQREAKAMEKKQALYDGSKQKRLDSWYSQAPTTAMDFSRSTQSIKDQVKAIQYLKQARDQLTVSQAGGEEAYKRTIKELNNEINRQQEAVDKLRGKQEQLQRSKKSLMNISDQLQRKLALLFSVSAIQGYINKLVTVRGEFELQQKSLQVLLQSKDDANKLWDETVKLAVKSPFSVKQLVTYTKQLAAYRIESDKLYQTNKMLADVSAGLGVDMQRLILAFGQVKSANYLRGTELRQFSEAGVNMLGELSKLYTELEGKMVSVGDVFERISKRQVAFSDVEEVFKRITSEGGVFYQMQEQQADTLKGMTMNLRDSIDLMLNDIGTSYDSTIKGLVSATKVIVENWRQIAPMINTVAGMLTGVLLSKVINGIIAIGPAFIAPFKKLVFELTLANTAGLSLKAILSSISRTGLGLILAAVGALIGALYSAWTYSTKLNEELSRIDLDLSKRLEDGIEKYHELADQVANVANSEYERNKALKALQQTFGEILPDEMLRKETIAAYAGNYEKAEKAMRSYYEAEKLKQSESKVRDSFDKDLESYGGDVRSHLKLSLDFTQDPEFQGSVSDEMVKRIKDRYVRVLNSVRRDAESGKISASANNLSQTFVSRLAKAVGTSEREIKQIFNTVGLRNAFKNYSDTVSDYLEEINNIQPLEYVSFEEETAAKQAKVIENQVALVQNAYSKIANLATEKTKGKVYWKDILPDISDALTEVKRYAPEYYSVLNSFWKKIEASANKGNFEFKSSLNDITDEFNEAVAKIAKAAGKGNTVVDNFAENLAKKLDEKKLTPQLKSIIELFSNAATQFDVPMSAFDNIKFGVETSLTETRNSVKTRLDEIKQQIKEFEQAMKSINSSVYNPEFSMEERVKSIETRMGMSSEEVAELKKQIPMLTLIFEALGGMFKTSRGKGSDPAKDFANVLQEMYREYEKMNDKFSNAESKARVGEYFKQTFADAAKRVKGFKMQLDEFDFTTFDGLISALEKLKKFAKDEKVALDIQKEIDKLKTERDTTAIDEETQKRERNVELLYEQYELFKDLKKLGASPEMAKNLFGIESMNLDALRKNITAAYESAYGAIGTKKWGSDITEAYQKDMDKITEMENKAQQARLKTYLEYTRDAMTERAKIKFEELKKLAEIEKTFAIKEGDTDEVKEIKNTQRTSAIEAVQKESAQQTNKALWEDFQKSDIFLSVFQDAENASVTMMEHVLAKLRGFKAEWANMPLESVKQITQKMTELENKLYEAQNPFKALREINKQIQDELTVTTTDESGKEVKTTISKEQLEADAKAAQAQIDANNTEIAQLQTINQLLSEGKLINSQQQAIYEQLTGTTDISVDNIEAEVNAREDANKDLDQTVQKNNKVNNLQNQGRKALLKQSEAIKQCGKMANDLYGAFSEIWEVAGGDEVTKMFADMGMSIATSVLDTIALQMQLTGATTASEMFGKSMNEAMGIIGWIVLAVQIIAKVLSTVFAAHDKGLQEQIEDIESQVEGLQKSLEKLEEQLETVYSSTSLRSAMQQVNANIERQIALRREQIELEKDKKSEDEEQIKDWNDEIEELKEKQAELHKEMVESLGGTYDVRSFAREFADAWIQSFEETGDGLKGLQDNFKEFMKNVLLEQAVMKGLGNIMKPVTDAINAALETDYQVDKLELNKIEKAAEDAMLQGNIFMKSLFGDGGIFSDYVNDTSSSLSGLQEGIQGVTEETAQIIEAYLNSIRFYIAQDNQNLAKLTQMFTNEETENPMLSQLKIIATQTSAIRMVFDSVVRGGHSQGGFGVKVFID